MPTSPGGSRFAVIYCGLLMSIGSFSIDITLPSIPAMVVDLSAPYGMVQWTVTIFMLAAGIGQLFWGTAMDRWGRKPVMGAGLAAYVAGSAIAASAPTIEILLAGRLLQGFGSGAGYVASRAIIRDLYSGEELARNLAFASMLFALGPIAAPLLGALVAATITWRAIFVVLGIWALVLAVLLTRMPETIRHKAADAMAPSVMLERTRRLIVHPQSRRFLLISFAAISAMLLVVAVAPRVYEEQYGIVGPAFAAYFAAHGTGIIIGQGANRRIIRARGIVQAAMAGNMVLALAAAGILVTYLAGWLGPVELCLLLILFATSYLIVYSNAAAMVLDPHGDMAGHATAFYGFSSQIGASIVVSGLVFLIGGSVVPWAIALLAICRLSLAFVIGWLRR